MDFSEQFHIEKCIIAKQMKKDKNKTFYEEIDMEVHEHDFKVNER
jgi:hypothetical protein